MPANHSCPAYPVSRSVEFLVLAGAVVVAVVSARGFAGGWNDGSRLATVECLVDQHTLAIDRSIFVRVPTGPGASPYPLDEALLQTYGTCDKLFIDGHYYSDKSPVPALFLGGLYQAGQWGTGLTARAQPAAFCYWMTVLSSGLAYVVAVCAMFRLGVLLGLALPVSLALTAGLGLATVALPYARQVNNHILLLGVTMPLLVGLVRLAQGGRSRGLLLGLGTLAGVGYTIDLGAGPVVLLCTLGVVLYRCRRPAPVLGFLLAALPWLVLHHAVNYATGGTWKPANAVPEYFRWPGCPFNTQNLTGSWHHDGVGHFLRYAGGLLVGRQGFLNHNPALFLALPAIVVLLKRRPAELPEVLFCGFCCGGVWLAYALTSNNSSGQCCSVRWFVPLLAPANLALAVFLREYPRYLNDFLILSVGGGILAGLAWLDGPWLKHLVPFYWPVVAAVLVVWAGYRARQWQVGEVRAAAAAPESVPKARAA